MEAEVMFALKTYASYLPSKSIRNALWTVMSALYRFHKVQLADKLVNCIVAKVTYFL